MSADIQNNITMKVPHQWYSNEVTDETDPTGVYSPLKDLIGNSKPTPLRVSRMLPFIYRRPAQQSSRQQKCKLRKAASTSIISGTKAVDFAAFSAGLLTLVLNINNSINNNNNNNNNINLNVVDSSNVVSSFNTNNANQVNIMPPGKKKRRRRRKRARKIYDKAEVKLSPGIRNSVASIMILEAIQVAMQVGNGQTFFQTNTASELNGTEKKLESILYSHLPEEAKSWLKNRCEENLQERKNRSCAFSEQQQAQNNVVV